MFSQQTLLEFREIREGEAVYYLATVKHTDRELLRFQITVVPPGVSKKVLNFKQTMYWDNP